MWNIRTSMPEDIPAQRQLWKLAFGDDDAYIDNFYSTYYRPERVIVLEEGGAVRSMSAWFDTVFRVPGQGDFRAAYLYAVATHPDCRGRGMSGALLAWADEYFKSLSIPAVTTVPAQPSLHSFFGTNGFRECFVLAQREVTRLPPRRGDVALRPLSPGEYGTLRDRLLEQEGRPYIRYSEQALAFQAGCCAVDGGGLYGGTCPKGAFCLCAEGAGEGRMVCKELLGPPEARAAALSALGELAPGARWQLRTPFDGENAPEDEKKFAMLKWNDSKTSNKWDWTTVGYLGLAFD